MRWVIVPLISITSFLRLTPSVLTSRELSFPCHPVTISQNALIFSQEHSDVARTLRYRKLVQKEYGFGQSALAYPQFNPTFSVLRA